MAPPSIAAIINRTTNDGGTIILNKYQLTHILGHGRFAKVYHGRSLIDNSSVPVKVIEKPTISDPTMELRLVCEVVAMRRLNQPNILKLHEVLATKTKIYLVMELAVGARDLHSAPPGTDEGSHRPKILSTDRFHPQFLPPKRRRPLQSQTKQPVC
ncbi:Protein kinase, ATP binding site-containing protein [Cynara cardunculus var. scolymus]|uniref:Protein kinase, ATP binding site-containing protein n=1 Tax=Cynara cardunculus var. scolymus TaxID=59895 RepID=A0A103Y6E7_CYNCS|nr:Protein kinase, ATP binding site-containing protein [Cynara cardunculus var. scolymus]